MMYPETEWIFTPQSNVLGNSDSLGRMYLVSRGVLTLLMILFGDSLPSLTLFLHSAMYVNQYWLMDIYFMSTTTLKLSLF